MSAKEERRNEEWIGGWGRAKEETEDITEKIGV